MNLRIDLILLDEGCVKSDIKILIKYSTEKTITETISKSQSE